MIAGARELEREGVKAITGDCGFMAIYQKEVKESVNIPVFLSSLLQIPFIKATLPEDTEIGIITANSRSLTPNVFKKIGVKDDSVVIFGLRDRDEVGSTFIRIIRRYARLLQQQDNLFMLEGLNERVLEQLQKTDALDLIGADNVFLADPRFGLSARQALSAAESWMKHQTP